MWELKVGLWNIFRSSGDVLTNLIKERSSLFTSPHLLFCCPKMLKILLYVNICMLIYVSMLMMWCVWKWSNSHFFTKYISLGRVPNTAFHRLDLGSELLPGLCHRLLLSYQIVFAPKLLWFLLLLSLIMLSWMFLLSVCLILLASC